MVVLPERLIDVMARHRLGGVASILVVHLVVRWPAESFGDGTIMRLAPGRSGRALRVTARAVDAAADRLAARRLIVVEVYRGRRHVRLAPLNFEVGGLWPALGNPGSFVVPAVTLCRVLARASRGLDSPLLLALLPRLAPGDTTAAVSTTDLATALRIERRSAQRVVARLVRDGLIRRVPGGLELAPLLLEPDGSRFAPMDGRRAEAARIEGSYQKALWDIRDGWAR